MGPHRFAAGVRSPRGRVPWLLAVAGVVCALMAALLTGVPSSPIAAAALSGAACDIPSYRYAPLFDDTLVGTGYQMGLTPSGTRLVVGGNDQFHIVDLGATPTMRSFARPGSWGAIAPADDTAYVWSEGGSAFDVVRLATGDVTGSITTGDTRGVALGADDSLYAANYGGLVNIVDAKPGSPSYDTVAGSVSTPSGNPVGVATLSGVVYAPHWGGATTTMSVIEGNSVTAVTGFPGGSWAIAVDSLSKQGYVTNNGNSALTPLDLANPGSPVLLPPISMASPWGVASEPGGARVFVTAYQDNKVHIINGPSKCIGSSVGLTGPSAVAFGRDDTVYVQAGKLWAFQRSLQPTFGVPTVASGGFTVNVTNYDDSWTWTPSVSSGTWAWGPAVGPNRPITVSGVGSGAAVTLKVDITRTDDSYTTGSTALNVTASSRPPTFGAPTPTAGGFTVNVTNYDDSWTWTPSVSSGTWAWGTRIGLTRPITVSGLATGASSNLTITTSRAGYLDDSATVTGSAMMPGRTPTFSLPVATAGGFTVNVTNYDDSWTWTPTATSGTATNGTPSGGILPITVTGLSAGASATMSVTTARSGYLDDSAFVTGQAQSAPDPPQPDPPGPSPSPSPVPLPSPVPPGSSLLLVDGVPRPVQVNPNLRQDGLDVIADGWTMAIDGLGADGQPLDLLPPSTLVLDAEREVRLRGAGFRPGSEVGLFAVPNASLLPGARRLARTQGLAQRLSRAEMASIDLGRVNVLPDGTFAGALELPRSLMAGNHVLQVVGFGVSGVQRALSLGILVRGWIDLGQGTRTEDGRHDRIRVAGLSGGLPAGSTLVPYIRLRGQTQFQRGTASITVQGDGSFTWSRKVRKSKGITAYMGYADVVSNVRHWRRSR